MEAYTIMPECYKQYTMSTLSSTPKKIVQGHVHLYSQTGT